MRVKTRFLERIRHLATTLIERSDKEINEKLRLEKSGHNLFDVDDDDLWRSDNIRKGNYLELVLDDVARLIGRSLRHPVLRSGKIPDNKIEANHKRVLVECKNHATHYRRRAEFWDRQDRFEGAEPTDIRVVVIPKLGKIEKQTLQERHITPIEIGSPITPITPIDELQEIYWQIFRELGSILYGIRGVFTCLLILLYGSDILWNNYSMIPEFSHNFIQTKKTLQLHHRKAKRTF